MPIDNLQQAAQQIASLLNSVIRLGGLRIKYRVSGADPNADPEEDVAVLNIEIIGPDAALLTQRGGELLRAFEHLSAQILKLEAREHNLISFDALNFKAERREEIIDSAHAAADRVHDTGQPYAFPPTNSRERRMLHMAFRDMEDVETQSHGEGAERYLVVYPKGQTDLPHVPPPMPVRGFGSRGSGGDRGGRRDGGRGRGGFGNRGGDRGGRGGDRGGRSRY